MKKVFVLSSIWFNLPTDRRGRGCRRGECSIVLERWRQFFLWPLVFWKLGWSLRKFWFVTNPQVVIEKKQLRGQVEIFNKNPNKDLTGFFWKYQKWSLVLSTPVSFKVGAIAGGGSGGEEVEEIFYLQLAQLLALTLLLTLLWVRLLAIFEDFWTFPLLPDLGCFSALEEG